MKAHKQQTPYELMAIQTKEDIAVCLSKNIKAQAKADKEIAALPTELMSVYENAIEPWDANLSLGFDFEILNEMVTDLYGVASPHVLLRMLRIFLSCRRIQCSGSHFEKAFQKALSIAERVFVAKLNSVEKECYKGLDEPKRTIFRICLDLALCEYRNENTGTFFLSYNGLAARIGRHSQEAYRLLNPLVRIGILRIVKKGMKRKSGEQAMATEYLWQLRKILPEEKPISVTIKPTR
jgi:hypothetical protein